MSFWVYILANRRAAPSTSASRTIWCAVFLSIGRIRAGFTRRYAIKMLIYYERHDTALAAIQREKNMKHWPREWKVDLIVSMNPDWRDLYEEITR